MNTTKFAPPSVRIDTSNISRDDINAIKRLITDPPHHMSVYAKAALSDLVAAYDAGVAAAMPEEPDRLGTLIAATPVFEYTTRSYILRNDENRFRVWSPVDGGPDTTWEQLVASSSEITVVYSPDGTTGPIDVSAPNDRSTLVEKMSDAYESQTGSTSVKDLIEILKDYDPDALVVINTGDDDHLTDVIAISTQTQIDASSVRGGRIFYTSNVDDHDTTINAVIIDAE